MIRFIAKFCLFLLGVFFAANVMSAVILSSTWLTSALGINRIGGEVYEALRKSNINFDSATIILGDSVAHQLFSVVGDVDAQMNNLTSNQAISLAGQYIIAHNALKNGPNVKDVFLIYHPSTFSNNLNQPFTFNYFVKPFFTPEYRSLLTPLVYNRLEESRYFMFFNFAMARTIPAFSTIDYSFPKKIATAAPDQKCEKREKLRLSFSEISIEYLEKLYTLCRAKGVRLMVIPPPISRQNADNYDYSIMKSQINDNHLEDIFVEYFERLSVINDGFFLPDKLHYKKDRIDAVSNEFLGKMRKDI